MRAGALLMMTTVLALFFLLDWYAFQGVKTLTANHQWRRGIHWGYWLVSAGLPIGLIVSLMSIGRMNPVSTTVGSLFITLLVTKLAFVLVLMGGDIWRVAEGLFHKFAGSSATPGGFLPERRKFVSQLAIGVAAIPFASFLYGITKGKYNYKVHRHTLYFEDLPAAFDGFTITQLSDVHSGSFDNADAVRRGVELANAQQSDLFVFTGDLVNNAATEFEPWIDIFSKITAPFGQFSILGNHDYGDYSSWPSKAAKQANFEKLKQHHATVDFRLLLDENVTIEKDGQQIALLGVENWGLGFGQRGDLNKALRGVPDGAFKILLSHDPSHWDAEVKKHPSPVHLTLSGHTHGMQMGVEIPGLRWSPVKYRYPKWAGLYEEAGKYINVNRGFGFLGFSGRVGIWPEITVLQLRRGNDESV
ncbi:MAG: metallophosphoesterase [Saprospiraceae bacterium]